MFLEVTQKWGNSSHARFTRAYACAMRGWRGADPSRSNVGRVSVPCLRELARGPIETTKVGPSLSRDERQILPRWETRMPRSHLLASRRAAAMTGLAIGANSAGAAP